MRILLSNDDGYLASGLLALYKSLLTIADVTVFAPAQNHSGTSNALTLQRPLTIHKIQDGSQKDFYVVDGTPTDCVHIALTGFLDFVPDMVVSGINRGQNMAEDVIYSGTVAAAVEGYFFGLHSVAFSQVDRNWENLAQSGDICQKFIANLAQNKPANPILWNVNIPSLSTLEYKGFHLTRLGKRHNSQAVIKEKSPRGENIYWIGPPGNPKDISENTDFHATSNGYTSVTPLQLDLTHYDALKSNWIKSCIPNE